MKIKVLNLENNKIWEEVFTSLYLMQKRINKLKYSKKLKIIFIENN